MKSMAWVRGSIEEVQLTLNSPRSNHSPTGVVYASPRIIFSKFAATHPTARDLLTNTNAMRRRQDTMEGAIVSRRKLMRGRRMTNIGMLLWVGAAYKSKKPGVHR